MENEGYEEEQAQLEVASRGTPRKVEIGESIESFRASAESHVYEDILVSGNAPELSKSDSCNENVSLELPVPMVGRFESTPRAFTTFTNSLSDRPETIVAAAAAATPTLLLQFEEKRGPIAELLEHSLATPADMTGSSCREDRHDSDCEGRNAEIGVKSLGTPGEHHHHQPSRQPSRRRKKRDCKHCKHRFTEEQLPRRQDAIAEKRTIQQDLSRTNTPAFVKPERLAAPNTRSIGLLPALHRMEEANSALNSLGRAVFRISAKELHMSNTSANYPTHRIPSKIEEGVTSTTPACQPHPVADMRVNSIYSKDNRIFFTDVHDSCPLKRAYSFATRVQSPVVQNRVNLRRSVRGEPPPEPARLSKDRHGWTLHFVKPLKKRARSRALLALILLIIGLLGIGSIALYIMCEPERLRVIQEYLKSSRNSSNSKATSEEMNATAISIPATSIGGAEGVDGRLNAGPLFTVTSSTREFPLNVQVGTVESPRDNFTRYCDDCLPGEVCVALISEEVPICRRVTDEEDPTGCGGLCIVNKQRCHRLDTDAFRCLDVEHSCLDDEWSCSNALCIPLTKRCDGHMNCYDHSDEDNCICNFETHFQCGNETSCLPLEKRCDSKIDCWDAADEINCTLACPMEHQFTCTNGECVLKTRFCDGLADCADGSDEPDGCQGRCNKYEFTCGNSRCIAKVMKCNGSDDCGDGSDERHCKSRQI